MVIFGKQQLKTVDHGVTISFSLACFADHMKGSKIDKNLNCLSGNSFLKFVGPVTSVILCFGKVKSLFNQFNGLKHKSRISKSVVFKNRKSMQWFPVLMIMSPEV